LVDWEELAIAERPAFGREVERHDPQFAQEWIGHIRPLARELALPREPWDNCQQRQNTKINLIDAEYVRANGIPFT
jgi:hypothetical protein